MRMVRQSHEIRYITGNPLGRIEDSGRVCWQSEDRAGENTAAAFVRNLVKRKHEAMLEFADMTVRFITNRGVTHELVRHRLASLAQESTRYCEPDIPGDMEFIEPVWWGQVSACAQVCFENALRASEATYFDLRRTHGLTKEQAREILPNDLKTTIDVKANFRQWRHIFQLRAIGTTGKPHPQMQALMLPLLAEVKQRVPVVFDDLNLAPTEAS